MATYREAVLDDVTGQLKKHTETLMVLHLLEIFAMGRMYTSSGRKSSKQDLQANVDQIDHHVRVKCYYVSAHFH